MVAEDQPLIREATVEEDLQIAVNFYNAFRKTWNHNWWSNAKRIPDPITLAQVPSLSRSQASRLLFYHALIKTVRLCDGKIRILCSPTTNQILGCAMWVPPGRVLPNNPSSWLRSGYLKLPFRWGWHGFRVIVFEFEGTVEKLFKAAFRQRRKEKVGSSERESIRSAAYLQMLAVNEEQQGKGYGSILAKEGLELYGKKGLVLLDASEEGPKRLYERLGFSVVGETRVGVGQCDSSGLRQGDLKSGGGPIWVMLYEKKVEV
ncbi:hypothetical protein T439DRAFT_354896 [Meredithblackwellia eburnea MCA 4105]